VNEEQITNPEILAKVKQLEDNMNLDELHLDLQKLSEKLNFAKTMNLAFDLSSFCSFSSKEVGLTLIVYEVFNCNYPISKTPNFLQDGIDRNNSYITNLKEFTIPTDFTLFIKKIGKSVLGFSQVFSHEDKIMLEKFGFMVIY
jgi:hypothetical protein